MKELKVVSVAWVDSASHPFWNDKDTDYDVLHCHSVGFLIQETDDMIAIAQSAALDDGAKPWADVIVIPTVAITNIIVLKEYVKEIVVKELEEK